MQAGGVLGAGVLCHPRLHRCALPHHQETLAACSWKASKEVCADSKDQLGG